MIDLSTLGKELRDRRRALRIPGAELARRIGVSPTYIWLIEGAQPRARGEPSRPSESVLTRWTAALGMSEEEARRIRELAGYFGAPPPATATSPQAGPYATPLPADADPRFGPEASIADERTPRPAAYNREPASAAFEHDSLSDAGTPSSPPPMASVPYPDQGPPRTRSFFSAPWTGRYARTRPLDPEMASLRREVSEREEQLFDHEELIDRTRAVLRQAERQGREEEAITLLDSILRWLELHLQ